MKKNSKMFVLFLTFLLAIFCLAGCGGGEEPAVEPEEPPTSETGEVGVMPEDLQGVVDSLLSTTEGYALQLDGQWGDAHVALMEMDLGTDAISSTEYADLKATLDGFRVECGAYYVYAMVPSDPAAASECAYLITVDGSEEPDDFLADYGFEVQFAEAYSGIAAPARSAWNDSDDDPVWSTFAPIHDSEGNVVAILGIDTPVAEVLNYPEWNRDSETWNGITE